MQSIRRSEVDGSGLKKGVGPVVRGGKQMRVTPDFGIKSAAASVEDTHDLPAQLAEAEGVAKRQAGVRLVGDLPYNHFSKAGLKHASLNNFYLLADLQHIGRNAAKLHIRV